ncbi:MAG: hypothetical protein FWD79_01060 [Desulfobulbus sp.]|nr:hypothetical protein [Desulfobulbus sp.]
MVVNFFILACGFGCREEFFALESSPFTMPFHQCFGFTDFFALSGVRQILFTPPSLDSSHSPGSILDALAGAAMKPESKKIKTRC